MDLAQFFQENPRCALAFSGGVDSAYLLYAAMSHGARVRPYYVRTPFQPAFEFEDAQRMALALGADMKVISLNVLEDERITANPANRCYYCKQKIFTAIREAAAADGLS